VVKIKTVGSAHTRHFLKKVDKNFNFNNYNGGVVLFKRIVAFVLSVFIMAAAMPSCVFAEVESVWLTLEEIRDREGVYLKRGDLFLDLEDGAKLEQIIGIMNFVYREELLETLGPDDRIVYVGDPEITFEAAVGYVSYYIARYPSFYDGWLMTLAADASVSFGSGIEYIELDGEDIYIGHPAIMHVGRSAANADLYVLFSHDLEREFVLGGFQGTNWVEAVLEMESRRVFIMPPRPESIETTVERTRNGYFYIDFNRQGRNFVVVSGTLLEVWQPAAAAVPDDDEYAPFEPPSHEEAYEMGIQMYEDGHVMNALRVFIWLGEFGTSAERVGRLIYRYTEDMIENEEFYQAVMMIHALNEYNIYDLDDAKMLIYEYAQVLLEKGEYYDAAYSLFILGDFLDARETANILLYNIALAYTDAGEYYSAAEILYDLGDFRDSRELAYKLFYEYGLQMIEEEQFWNAASVFYQIRDYEDSAALSLQAYADALLICPYNEREVNRALDLMMELESPEEMYSNIWHVMLHFYMIIMDEMGEDWFAARLSELLMRFDLREPSAGGLQVFPMR